MHSMRNTTIVLATAGLTLPSLAQTRHEGDFFIGVNGAGRLAVEGDFDDAHQLPAFDSGGVRGWFGDEPGFASLDVDEPDEDFYTLAPGADIWFELLSIDPAFKVYDPFFTPVGTGDGFGLGGHEFDEHAFWHIDSDDPAFDPGQSVWTITWRVTDMGATGYDASGVYTSQFTNIPAPGGLAGAGVAALAFLRRRR